MYELMLAPSKTLCNRTSTIVSSRLQRLSTCDAVLTTVTENRGGLGSVFRTAKFSHTGVDMCLGGLTAFGVIRGMISFRANK